MVNYFLSFLLTQIKVNLVLNANHVEAKNKTTWGTKKSRPFFGLMRNARKKCGSCLCSGHEKIYLYIRKPLSCCQLPYFSLFCVSTTMLYNVLLKIEVLQQQQQEIA